MAPDVKLVSRYIKYYQRVFLYNINELAKESIERAKRGGHLGVGTKLVREALELLDSTKLDIERGEVIAEQLENKMKILDEGTM